MDAYKMSGADLVDDNWKVCVVGKGGNGQAVPDADNRHKYVAADVIGDYRYVCMNVYKRVQVCRRECYGGQDFGRHEHVPQDDNESEASFWLQGEVCKQGIKNTCVTFFTSCVNYNIF